MWTEIIKFMDEHPKEYKELLIRNKPGGDTDAK